MRPLILWGASGHAKVLREILEPAGYKAIAMFDNSAETKENDGVVVYKGEEGFHQWQSSYQGPPVAGVVAIGSPGQARVERQRFFEQHNIEVIRCSHPNAFVATSATLGKGCQVLAQAAVCAGSTLGAQCIVNTAASVDHECLLGDAVHVAPGARVLGCVEIGDYSFIGGGAIVLSRVRIGQNSIVGAGSVVTKDVGDNVVVFGSPAMVRKKISGPARPA